MGKQISLAWSAEVRLRRQGGSRDLESAEPVFAMLGANIGADMMDK